MITLKSAVRKTRHELFGRFSVPPRPRAKPRFIALRWRTQPSLAGKTLYPSRQYFGLGRTDQRLGHRYPRAARRTCCAITKVRYSSSRTTVCSLIRDYPKHCFQGQGCLKEYIGGYQDYIDAKSREDKIQTASVPKAVAEPEKVKPKANRTVKLPTKSSANSTRYPTKSLLWRPSRLKSIPSFPILKFQSLRKSRCVTKQG